VPFPTSGAGFPLARPAKHQCVTIVRDGGADGSAPLGCAARRRGMGKQGYTPMSRYQARPISQSRHGLASLFSASLVRCPPLMWNARAVRPVSTRAIGERVERNPGRSTTSCSGKPQAGADYGRRASDERFVTVRTPRSGLMVSITKGVIARCSSEGWNDIGRTRATTRNAHGGNHGRVSKSVSRVPKVQVQHEA
jgi:hypothetical protein